MDNKPKPAPTPEQPTKNPVKKILKRGFGHKKSCCGGK